MKINRITENLGLKIFSLFFALFIWFFVVNEEKAEINLAVPLELTNLPEDFMVEGLPSHVTITVYGPRSLLQFVAGQKLIKTLNMENVQKGTMRLQLNPDLLDLPSGVKITRVQPSTLELNVVKYKKKEVPVKLQITGHPHKDYKVVDYEVMPSKIVIYGSEEVVEKVRSIETPPIDISNSTESIQRILKLDFKEHGFTSDVTNLFVKVTIEAELGSITFNKIPIKMYGIKENFKVNISQRYAEITLEGPKNILHKMKADDVEVFVNINNLDKGLHRLKLEIKLTDNIRAKTIKPEEVTVRIQPDTKQALKSR